MDAVTYPNTKVSALISTSFIPLRVRYNEQPLAGEFHVTSTPTIIILDHQRQEHHRIQGFTPPEEFVPALLLGIAKIDIARENFRDALDRLEKIERNFDGSISAAEAIYRAGISRYKTFQDSTYLKEMYNKLQESFPESDWTKQAEPYRLL